MSRCTPFVLLLALWAGHAQAADLAASIDRSRVNSGETVELTIESNDVTQFGKPDLAPPGPAVRRAWHPPDQPTHHP